MGLALVAEQAGVQVVAQAKKRIGAHAFWAADNASICACNPYAQAVMHAAEHVSERSAKQARKQAMDQAMGASHVCHTVTVERFLLRGGLAVMHLRFLSSKIQVQEWTTFVRASAIADEPMRLRLATLSLQFVRIAMALEIGVSMFVSIEFAL